MDKQIKNPVIWELIWDYLIKPGLIILGLALITKALVYQVAKNRRNLLRIIPLTAALLTGITIGQLQDSSVIFKTEAAVLQKLTDFKQKIIQLFYSDKEDENFVKNNFILINTSYDPYLIPNKEGLSGDSTLVAITDRRKLANFLNFVHQNISLFDLVVCDIVFTDSSINDGSLKNVITAIEEENKIVLAYNKYFVNIQSTIYSGMNPSSYGEVAKVEINKPFYFTHLLINEENIPSLPYQMHLRLSGSSFKKKGYYFWPKMIVEKGRNNIKRYAFNEFITELNFTNEQELYNDNIDRAKNQQDNESVQDTLIRAAVDNMYDLGYSCTEEAQQQILDLVSSKDKKYRNIVMIGNFRDAYSDKHQTAFGPLYGTTILLNEFFQIDKNQHSLKTWQIIVYVSTLFLCFCGVLAFLFWRAFKKEKKVMPGSKRPLKFVISENGFLVNIMEFILDETHYLLLFGIAILMEGIFHKIINVLGLLYYFLLFSALLKFFIRKKKMENNLKNIY